MVKKTIDFLIIGSGSAGCVLANRLSEDPSNQVLMLEAGRRDSLWDIFIHMPAALTIPIGNKNYDWMYHSEPEPFMNQRRIYHARGKLLGGSSSINGMIWQRGNPMDFDRWAEKPGLSHWSYAHCLPYFKKMENSLATGETDFRGGNGPLELEKGPGNNPLFHAFLNATKEAGYPATTDVNGYRQEGFALFDRNVRNGRRLSSARAYIHPILNRENLKVRTKSFVSKILIEKNKAVGVICNGEKIYAKEIILSAGAFASPQLLQLSGVGPVELLQSHKIPVVQELNGVGKHLEDHLEVYIQHLCKKPVSMNPQLKWHRKPWLGFQWLFLRQGAAATNHFEAGGFARSNKSVMYPNLMFHFLPLAIRYNGSAPKSGHGYQAHVGPMYSDVRGSVKIQSPDASIHPKIRFNYLSTKNDRKEWVEAVKVARNILKQSSMDEFNGGEISPGTEIETDEQILDWVSKDAETALHPCCTCRMGSDNESVVDPANMKVFGIEGLRVVDASSMPSITNGNIHAPISMIAEKACDLILENTPLPPERIPYYKHQL